MKAGIVGSANKRGFVGLLLFFFIFPLALASFQAEHERQEREAMVLSDMVALQRNRFLEANVRNSFLRVLSSAEGKSGAAILFDASAKLERWQESVFDAANSRGLSPSLWAGCSDASRFPGQRKAFEKSRDFFLPMLSFDSETGNLFVKYSGNDTDIGTFDCAKKDLGITLESESAVFDYVFPQGLYASTNSTGLGFGFDGGG